MNLVRRLFVKAILIGNISLGSVAASTLPTAETQLAAPPVLQLSEQLYQQVVAPESSAVVDLAEAEQTLKKLNLLLAGKMTLHDQLTARYMRGRALFHIAGTRYVRGLAENRKDSLQALEDIEFVLANAGEFTLQLQGLAFEGGILSLNHLQMNDKAAQLWTLCAKAGHAGCMSELATFYFNGEFGFERNLSKSVSWHQRVVATGLKFRCAGIYSSSFLAQLSFFKPRLATGKTAEQWWQQMQTLSDAYNGNSGEENKCEIAEHHLMAYVLKHSAGLPVEMHWQQIKLFSHDESQQIILNWFVQPEQAEAAFDVIDQMTEPYLQSTAWYAMLLHSHFTGQRDVYRKALQKLEGQDPVYASSMLSWINLLRVDGVLP